LQALVVDAGGVLALSVEVAELLDLGGGHGCSRFVVEALASCPHILQAPLPVSRGGCSIS
jgi:hypothetical protein